eukprot:TRINITY_DN12182_c0_g1_i13.p3 TRINITY_DN12182_c0_g1~~TRINITY_DN12182_c0_g1_i13.p3  ORF type:complete len:203 (+),score=40.01 TRINITY_DN12182_c0_g1_i13:826-1434(+)
MELYNYVTVQSKQATINEMDGVYVAIALDPAYRSGICTATTSNVNLTVNTMPGGMSPVSGSVSMSSAEVALMVNANNQDIQQLSTTLFDCFVSKQTLNTTIADINDDLANSLRVASAISSRLDLVVDDVDATVTRLGVVDSQIEEVWVKRSLSGALSSDMSGPPSSDMSGPPSSDMSGPPSSDPSLVAYVHCRSAIVVSMAR